MITSMPPSRLIQIRVSQEIAAAIEAHCAKNALEISTFVRSAVMRELGRPDLLDTMRQIGRPPTPPPAAAKKSKRRSGS